MSEKRPCRVCGRKVSWFRWEWQVRRTCWRHERHETRWYDDPDFFPGRWWPIDK